VAGVSRVQPQFLRQSVPRFGSVAPGRCCSNSRPSSRRRPASITPGGDLRPAGEARPRCQQAGLRRVPRLELQRQHLGHGGICRGRCSTGARGRASSNKPRPSGAERQPAWLSFFAVKDVDAAEKSAVERGREAVLADPQSTVFALLASTAAIRPTSKHRATRAPARAAVSPHPPVAARRAPPSPARGEGICCAWLHSDRWSPAVLEAPLGSGEHDCYRCSAPRRPLAP
jgi:hypothetical protein